MAINKKLIHFKNKQKFNEELANGNILETSIVFILDTTEIYTHGLLYDGSKVDLSNIEEMISKIKTDGDGLAKQIPTRVSQLVNDSNYITETELSAKVSGDGNILNIVKVTALPSSPDANTLYVIVES